MGTATVLVYSQRLQLGFTCTPNNNRIRARRMIRFIDLFAGCGGLSLGLSWSGFQGLFAVERDPMAFRTLESNLIHPIRPEIRGFSWPSWLERKAWGIDELLKSHRAELAALQADEIELIAGGPPCQGFSFAGRRDPHDPRNQLFRRYLEVVRLVRPTAVLLENVPGMAVAHGAKSKQGRRNTKGSFYEALAEQLDILGYDVDGKFVDACEFGVPQKRVRLIVVGLLRHRMRSKAGTNLGSMVLERLKAGRAQFISSLGLQVPVSAEDAIGDLSLTGRDGREWPLRPCEDPESPAGFQQLSYDGRRAKTAYQRLMHGGYASSSMDSMRLARHSDEVRSRFSEIISTCRQGVRMNEEDRAMFKLRKHRIYPMSAGEPAPTITTLPDDVLHYRDPRILTVRECARLQSFPDWFVFKGKYTTGGDRRVKECPRYTQVGNAVPPLLAMAVAQSLGAVLAAHGKAAAPAFTTAWPEREAAVA